MSRARIAAQLFLLAAAIPPMLAADALAADGPTLLPTRDVTVSYRQEQGGTALDERLAFSAASQRMRLDAPGSFLIFDYRLRRGVWARESAHVYVAVERPVGAPAPAASPDDYERVGAAQVAGLPCTEWRLRRASPEIRICLAADGVMLAVEIAGRMRMTATDIRYGPPDASLFELPAGYTALAPRP